MPRSAKPKVLVIGDVMLDEYLAGSVTRMSPEVPTAPVLAINERDIRLGGAANVAHNVALLGGDVELIGIRGADEAGTELVAALKKLGIKDLLVVTNRPTTCKTRLLDQGNQLMRVDVEDASSLAPKARTQIISAIKKSRPDIVIVSDYAKGVFSKEIAKALLDKFGGGLLIGDIKPANAKLVKGFRAVTPNRHEAIAMLGGGNRADRDLAVELRKKLGCGVAVTLGEHGSMVCDTENKGGTVVDPHPVDERDVTGAGDTFTAALALGLARGKNLAGAAHQANIAAAIAVSQQGTVAVKAHEVQRHI